MSKTKKFISLVMMISLFAFSFNLVGATSSTETTPTSSVDSISLSASGANISWTADGYSAKGYKVVWSKNTNPTYPTRSGDKYHYFSNPNQSSDTLTAFSGNGTYYVSVCEYLSGKCGVYSNEIAVVIGGESDSKTCTDSDNGKKFDVKGETKVCEGSSCETKVDRCDGEKLKEFYCSGNELKDYSYYCPAGCNAGVCATGEISGVQSINLSQGSDQISWLVDGYSAKGYKVVWSKNSAPTYPTRSGDRYHYFSNPSQKSDYLKGFDGGGTYYVRVCEYLDGNCGVYSNEIEVSLEGKESVTKSYDVCTSHYAPVCGVDSKIYSNKCFVAKHNVKIKHYGRCQDNNFDVENSYNKAQWECTDGTKYEVVNETGCKSKSAWKTQAGQSCSGDYSSFEVNQQCQEDLDIININNKAKDIFDDKFSNILGELKKLRDVVKEQSVQIKYLTSLKEDVQALSSQVEEAVNQFITYGVDANTEKLGAGERAAVMHSFKSAFKKLPETEEEMADAIKIANGRWPTLRSEESENRAKENFVRIYKRDADMDNANDNAAVTVMAYGLRQKAENRKLDSEKNGINIFKGVFGHHPKSTEDWNTMQAITYSGASR